MKRTQHFRTVPLVISSIITALLSVIDSRDAQRQFHPKITQGNVLNAVILVVKVSGVYLLNAFICFHLWMKGLKNGHII